MVDWTERNRYEASWGDWYIQVVIDGEQTVEMKFDHLPTNAEIDPVVQLVWESIQSTIEIVAENGTVL